MEVPTIDRSSQKLKTSGLVACLLAMILLTGCESVGRRGDLRVTQEQWQFGPTVGRKVITPHFDIHSTLTDQVLEEALPQFLEAAYAQYSGLVKPRADGGDRLETYVFQHRREWERFAAQRFPQRFPVYRHIGAGGFAEGNLCVVYYIKRPYTLSVLAHEGMHQYLAANCSVPLPAWLNEGLATYCESYELSQDRPRFTPKHNTFRINALRQALREGAILPLAEMLATDAGSVIIQGESAKTRTYYAQAWALVCYLRHGSGGRYAGGLNRLLKELSTGDVPTMARAAKIRAPKPAETSYGEAVFRAYITEDLPGFVGGFEDYLYDLAGYQKSGDGG